LCKEYAPPLKCGRPAGSVCSMMWPTKTTVSNWVLAAVLWVGVAFSLGWYHYLTPLGRKGWPLPTPESAAALVGELFTPRSFGLAHDQWSWLVLVPCAGLLWVCLLYLTAAFFGENRVGFSQTLKRFALSNVPLVVAGPLLMAASWKWDWGYWWEASRLLGIEARVFGALPWTDQTAPWSWLGPVFLAVGGAVLGIQCAVYWQSFQIPGKRIVPHVLVSAGLLLAVAAGAGPLVSAIMDLLS
jgi:hypothetical protein